MREMAGTKEIKTHIESVQETQKITNAMYLMAFWLYEPASPLSAVMTRQP